MLDVTLSLTVGNFLYDQHIVAMRLRRTQLSALDRLEILFPASVTFEAEPGEDCSLEIDGGDGAATVFTGQLTQVQHSLSGLHIEAHNGGLALARYRPSMTLEQQTIGDIINSLCSDADIDVASNIDGATLALYVADGRATAAQEIARLALLAGAACAFDGDGSLHISEDGGPGGELALHFGRELLAGEICSALANENILTVVGEGADAASSDQGRWIITDFLKGSGSPPGFNGRTIAQPELRTTDDTEFAAAAFTHRRAAGEAQVRLRTWLHPQLQPGMRMEFADMPDHLPLQECRIRQVISTLSPFAGASTEVWASGQVGGASAFGDLLGAIGGLL
ncbi:MAG: hypothetical protein L0Z73_19020 [Gammaproteobacteria bacterium]|nr:hypothetical protein [Gammaproteobacteria bacterium]